MINGVFITLVVIDYIQICDKIFYLSFMDARFAKVTEKSPNVSNC